MLKEGKPDLVIAFPGGRGTDMMVGLAKDAGVEVLDLRNRAFEYYYPDIVWRVLYKG
jgi:hypothetical protein